MKRKRRKNPHFCGYLVDYSALLFPLGGIGLGITSLLYANSTSKRIWTRTIKQEKIIAIVGICSFR